MEDIKNKAVSVIRDEDSDDDEINENEAWKPGKNELLNVSNKRCLIVLHRFWPFLGGSEKQFLKWAEILDDKNFKVRVFTTNIWDNDYFFYPEKKYIKETSAKIGKNIKIKRFKIAHLPRKNALLSFLEKFPSKTLKFLIGKPYIFVPGYYLYMFFSALFLPKKFDFVIAGVFPHYYLIYPALFYAKVKNIPFIMSPLVHFGQPNDEEYQGLFLNEKSRYLLDKSDYILTITEEEREKLIALGISGTKIKVSGIGIEENDETLKGDGERFRKKYNINGPYVLQISTQTHDKGSHHTVEAMKVLWRRGVKIKLVLIGQILAEFEEYLINQKPEVFENTIILNYASDMDKNDALDGCDVFTMPSKSDSFGLVYLEAWLHKKPVIAAYCSGVTEVIEEGINGFFVPFGDYEMIAGYIYKLINDKKLSNRLGEEGFKKAFSYFWEKRLKNFIKLIENLKL